MNTKITLEFNTGEYGTHEVSDEVETLILKGEPLTIKSAHPSVGNVLIVEAGNTREHRAEQLIRDMYKMCTDSHTTHQHQPYTWAELNPDLMKRLVEFM